MDDRAVGALEGFVRALDQVLPGLREDLDGDVVGNAVALDELSDEIEIRLRRRREAHLDLLVAHPHQEVEHPMLALGAHGVDQRLVTVPEVHRAPARRLGDELVGPGAVREFDGDLILERRVLGERHSGGLL